MLIKGSTCKWVVRHSRICMAIVVWTVMGCATSSTPQRSSEEPSPANIEAIKVSSSGGQMTVVEIINSVPAPYTSFRLINPPRVVLDIQGVPGKDLPLKHQVNDINVSDIHVQSEEAQGLNTRVVIGLSRVVDYVVTEKENIISLRLLPKMATDEPIGEKSADITLTPQKTKSEEGSGDRQAEPRIFFKPRPTISGQILGVDFSMLDFGKSRLTVTTDKTLRYSLERIAPKTLLLTVEDATIPPLLLRRLDSSHFEGAVDKVKPAFSSKGDRVSLAISLREMVPFHVNQVDSEIQIDFGPTTIRPPEMKIIPVKVKEAQELSAETAEASAKEEKPAKKNTEIPGLGKGKYTGTRMTMDFVNADVTNILRLIGDVSNLNIIWGPEVKGAVSMRLKNVPWDQALDLVLANNDLAMRREGGVIWVTTRAHMAEIEAEEKKKQDERHEDQKKAEETAPLLVEYFPLDFAEAKQLKELIDKSASAKGSVSVDSRTNTIIMKDTAQKIEEARQIIERFDAPTKQIMIEARIVDASTSFGQDLGLRWNATTEGQKRNSTGTTWSGTPLWAPDNVEADFGSRGFRYGGTFSTNSPENWNPNIGLNFARLTSSTLGGIALDASLALAESEGKAKIISAPKVIASNGEKARISRGDIIYKEIVTADQRDIKELPATLSLSVTPTVSFNDYVTMEIEVKDDKVFADLSGKTEKGITTKLMVRSGETLVIGGIFKEDTSTKEEGVPWLRDIPYLGWLFKVQIHTKEKTELLIFLTPRVVQTAGENA
jgi:type IV pilus assembly protein PilQ